MPGPGPDTTAARLHAKLQGTLVMSRAGLAATRAAHWLLGGGPRTFKKQVHGMDCNGNTG